MGRLTSGLLFLVLSGCVDPSLGGYDANGNPVSSENIVQDQEKQVFAAASEGRVACGKQFSVDPNSLWTGPKDTALDHVRCINKLESDILLPYFSSIGLNTAPFLNVHSEREQLALRRERGRIDSEEYGVEIRSLKNRLEAEMRTEVQRVVEQRRQQQQVAAQQQLQRNQTIWQGLSNLYDDRPVQTNCITSGPFFNCTTR